MGKHAEIIYENGESSVASIDDDDTDYKKLVDSVKNHHERAINGLPIHNSWGPDERPIIATRIKRVLIYDHHPGDLQENISPDVATSTVQAALSKVQADTSEETGGEGVVNLYALGHELLPKALKEKEHPHDSEYVAEESEELDPALWGGE